MGACLWLLFPGLHETQYNRRAARVNCENIGLATPGPVVILPLLFVNRHL
jgi:hypothetical protein